LKAGGPADSSNLVNERVNYDEVTSVDLASTPQGFEISVLTDRIEVKFFVHEDWRAQDAVDSLDDHSESGLKPGSIIEIVYTVEVLGENYATAGAAEVLEKAMVRRAYLKQGSWGDTGFDSSYNAAARGQSFESIK
jgi:hypothetical protein